MSLFKAGVITGPLLTFILTLVVIIGVIMETSLTFKQIFLTGGYVGIPVGVIFLTIALIVGGVLGGVLSVNLRKQLDTVNRQMRVTRTLSEPIQLTGVKEFKEITLMKRAVIDLQTRYQQQVIASQQLSEQTKGSISTQTKEDILMNERQRLARELHDSVSQQLFAATMMLSAVNETVDETALPPVIVNQLHLIEKTINESQSEMRALLLHLRPVLLEGKSLQQGIEGLLRELQSKVPLKMTWKIDPIVFPTALENHLFRVVQELISNTMRHAKAHHLNVYFKQVQKIAILRVVDDGKGFEVTAFNANLGSYGLQNVQERINEIGGSLKIISFPKQGTSVEIKIPIVEEGEADD